MGLHLCYELSLPATFSEGEVLGVVSQLHACASTMGLDRMTPIVRVAPNDPVPPGGLAFPDLADFFRVIASIVEEPHDEDGYPVAPSRETPRSIALGFAVVPGAHCEAATFGFAAPSPLGATAHLLREVHEMNRVVAAFAGKLHAIFRPPSRWPHLTIEYCHPPV